MPTHRHDADSRFDVLFEQRPGYLYARVLGAQVSLDIAAAYWHAIAAHCSNRAPQPLLVVEDLAGVSPDREERLPEFRERLDGLGLERHRIAVVKRVTADMGLAEYAALGMQELGWTIRLFSSQGEAMLWLLHGPA